MPDALRVGQSIAASVVASACDGAFERLRISPHRRAARAEVRDRGLLARRASPRRSCSRPRAASAPRNWQLQRDAGIDLIPSNDFSLYDQVLDTIALVGAVPDALRMGRGGDVDLDTYFAMARGRQERRRRRHRDGDDEVVRHELPLHRPRARARDELHALARASRSTSTPEARGARDRDQAGADRPAHVPAAGQVRRRVRGVRPPRAARRRCVEVYARGARASSAGQGAELGAARRARACRGPHAERELDALERAYERARRGPRARPGSCVNTYFDHVGDAYPRAARPADRGHRARLPSGAPTSTGHGAQGPERRADRRRTAGLEDKTLFAGVVAGRNVWINELERSLDLLRRPARAAGAELVVSTSCSLLHSPDRQAQRASESSTTRSCAWMAFAMQKLGRGRDARPRARRGRARRSPPSSTRTTARSRTARNSPPHPQPRGARPARGAHRRRRAPPEPVRGPPRGPARSASGCRCSRPRRSAPSRRRPRSARRARELRKGEIDDARVPAT